MSDTHRIRVLGIKEGFARDAVVSALTVLLARSESDIREILAAERAIVRNDMDLMEARKFRLALEQRGCSCLIEPDNQTEETKSTRGTAARPKGALPLSPDFSTLKLKRFASAGLGIALDAPENWEDTSGKEHFHVMDPASYLEFTATVYHQMGLTLEQWAAGRHAAAQGSGSFREVSKYTMRGRGWSGLAAEFRGRFAISSHESHYLVLCLRTDKALTSFTVTAPTQAFVDNELLIRWLLANHLEFPGPPDVEVVTGGTKGESALPASFGTPGEIAAKVKQILEKPGVLISAFADPAKQGNAEAQRALAEVYRRGEGVPQNPSLAVEWFRKSAEQGNRDAQAALGLMYRNGEGVAQDSVQALKWMRMAAEQGNTEAQFLVGYMHAAGEGTVGDDSKAFEWYMRAAKQDNRIAQASVAECYQHGRGVRIDMVQAYIWYRRSAEKGLVDSQRLLAHFYEVGMGVEQNMIQALAWFRKAAAQGCTYSLYRLGEFCYLGNLVTQNYPQAYQWFLQAAKLGLPAAQAQVADMHIEGKGVPKDRQKALEWYQRAADNGHKGAIVKLVALSK